jgi:hypothetical protein
MRDRACAGSIAERESRVRPMLSEFSSRSCVCVRAMMTPLRSSAHELCIFVGIQLPP